MTLTLRSLTALPALLAACMLPTAFATPASAASIPVRTLFHHAATATAKPQYVVINFRNTSPQQRAVQVGKDQFPIAPGRTLNLSVAVGSEIKVRSEVNSKIDGTTLLKVNETADKQYILVN